MRENIQRLPTMGSQPRIEPVAWVRALTRNQTHNLSMPGMMLLQPTEPHQSGLIYMDGFFLGKVGTIMGIITAILLLFTGS